MIVFGFYFVHLLEICLLKCIYSVSAYHYKFIIIKVNVRERNYSITSLFISMFLFCFMQIDLNFVKDFIYYFICGNDALTKHAVIHSRFKASLYCFILLASRRVIELLLRECRCSHLVQNVIFLRMVKANLFYSQMVLKNTHLKFCQLFFFSFI